MNHWENKLMILAWIVGFALQFAVTEEPFLIDAFGTSHLSGKETKQGRQLRELRRSCRY